MAELVGLDRRLSDDAMQRLDAEILAAHAIRDDAALAVGYRTGGLNASLCGADDAACFLFTQAYVFAMRAGLAEVTQDVWLRLKSHGREM